MVILASSTVFKELQLSLFDFARCLLAMTVGHPSYNPEEKRLAKATA